MQPKSCQHRNLLSSQLKPCSCFTEWQSHNERHHSCEFCVCVYIPCTCLMGNPLEHSYCLSVAVKSVSLYGLLHLLQELHVNDIQYWQTPATPYISPHSCPRPLPTKFRHLIWTPPPSYPPPRCHKSEGFKILAGTLLNKTDGCSPLFVFVALLCEILYIQ